MTAATYSNTSATSTSHPHPHRPSSSAASASASATQACAACKYQRRKCNRDCTLAPYFPADQQRQFLNAHRLFGVSNILKITRHLDPVQRAEAMRSIIFQSNARAHDPVGGCYRIILELERQLQRDSAELALVLRQLAICRSQARPAPSPATTAVASDLGVVNPNLILNADDTVGVVLPMHQQQPQQQFCDYFYYDDPHDDHHNNNGKNHHRNYNNRGVVDMEVPTTSMPCEVEEEEEDVKPLVDMFEIRQALIGDDEEESAKNFAAAAAVAEPFQCSGKIESKEELNPIEDVPEHDLKGAVSLFTLTNCTSSSSLLLESIDGGLKRTRWCYSQGKIRAIQRIYATEISAV